MVHDPDPRPDDALDRLRAADPAADLTPDAVRLHAAVRARVGDGVHEPAVDGVHGGAPDDLAAARAARRGPHRWLAVAAVAVGALVVGSAGYALGDRPDEVVASAATSAITLPGTGAAPEAAGSVDARGGTESIGAIGADILPWYGGRTVFTAEGLSDEAGTAPAWSFDPAAVFGPETAARVAAALGLAAEPRLEGVTWVVGAQDGRGPSLQLQPDGTTTVSYYDPTRDPFGCPTAITEEGAVEDGSTSSDGAGTDPAGAVPAPDVPQCVATDVGPAPQGDEAVARVRDVLAAAGVDPDGFEYEVMDAGTPEAAYVTAHAVLGGQRTGLTWNVTLAGDGVQSLYGFLAPLVPLGDYAVVSPDAAVDRLSDPRFGSTGGPIMAAATDVPAVREPMIEPDSPVTGGDPAMADGEPPAPIGAGADFAWPVTEVVLTTARLGVTMHMQPDGATALVPAYELSDAQGATWSVIAVTEEALDFAPVR